MGLKTGSVDIAGIDWSKLPLPAIAFLRPIPASVEQAVEQTESNPPTSLPVLILKSDGQKLLYFRAGSQTPETIAIKEAPQHFEPDLILFAKKLVAWILSLK